MNNESNIEKYDYETFYKSLMHTTALIEKLSKDTDRRFQETDLKFKETDLKFKETDKKFKETDKKFKETDKKFKETDLKFQETDKELKELISYNKLQDISTKNQDKKVKELNYLFVNQWGQLVETLVEGKLIEILNNRNIPVNQITRRYEAKYNGSEYEFDIIAINGSDVVIVEVKTTLTVKYAKAFIEKLKIIKEILPIYKNFNIIGAIAYIKSNEQADKFSQSQGLFTIRATGDSAFITNNDDFKPKFW